MDQKQRAQAGILIACLVIGLVIVAWLLAGMGSRGERLIVVGENAKPRAASRPATTRVAATRPMKTAFIQAIWSNKHDKAIAMLKEDPKLSTIEIEDDGFSTALHVAAFHGDLELAGILLDDGADLEAVEINHQGTPLEWAAYAGQFEMAKLLLARGAKVNDDCLVVATQGANGRINNGTTPRAAYREILKLLQATRKGATTVATTQAAGR